MSRNYEMHRFFGVRPALSVQPLSQPITSALDDDEITLELDEPPDHQLAASPQSYDAPSDMLNAQTAKGKDYVKQPTTPFNRQCSLLTQSLLSVSTPNDTHPQSVNAMARASSQASAYSLSSNHGLTSDGGFSSPAPSGTPSPPLPAAMRATAMVSAGAAHARSIRFAGDKAVQPASREPATQQNTRKMRISFAGGPTKVDDKDKVPSGQSDQPKRPCTIRFACNSRPITPIPVQPISSQRKPATPDKSLISHRNASPFPGVRKRRGSQSTPSDGGKSKLSGNGSVVSPSQAQKLEKERLKKLASNRPEDEAWVNETPKERKPLTVTDTLRKENVIRQLAVEAEEEALEEAINDLIDDEDDEDEEPATGSRYMAFDEGDSDDGHETDDEGGFAESDDDSDDDPDFQFWTNGISTAATLADPRSHRRHQVTEPTRPKHTRTVSESSFDSVFKADHDLNAPRFPLRRTGSPRYKSPRAMKMRPGTPELPDSTDFVCGTLDEDKPLEDAYLSCLKQRTLEKRGIIPQDLDPSFPTSDPENNDDEEDEVTEGVASTASDHHFLGGRFDESDGSERRGRDMRTRPSEHSSPQRTGEPSLAHRQARAKSPAPIAMKRIRTKSPAPTPMQRIRTKSPAPVTMQRIRTKSPAPPSVHRHRAKSPAPRMLFGHSPIRPNSPLPAVTVRSPPASPRNSRIQVAGLAERPGHIKTASLPHTPNPFFTTQERRLRAYKRICTESDGHDRGPIDIKQGLEERKQRRKEHYWRKHCRDHKDRSRRCAPGKGAERMRELGLEMAHRNKAYGQKLQLMLSV